MKAESEPTDQAHTPSTAFRRIPEGSKKVAGAWSASAEAKAEGGKRNPRKKRKPLDRAPEDPGGIKEGSGGVERIRRAKGEGGKAIPTEQAHTPRPRSGRSRRDQRK